MAQEQNIGGPQLGPQQLDYEATTKGLSGLESSLDQINDITNRGRQERLQIQEKFNQLEIERDDAAFKNSKHSSSSRLILLAVTFSTGLIMPHQLERKQNKELRNAVNDLPPQVKL